MIRLVLYEGEIMLIPSLLISKENLPFISTQETLETALDILENTSFRCLPILDASGTLYRGNIYKYHIYRHVAKGGSLQDSVTTLLKNATKFIRYDDSFFTLFFKLSDLPYISVLDEQHHFIGIVQHEDVMRMLSQTWRLSDASYAITIEIPEDSTSFMSVIKLIKKFTDITGIITLDKADFLLRKRIIVTFPKSLTTEKLNKLVSSLTKKHYSVIDIEDLRHGV